MKKWLIVVTGLIIVIAAIYIFIPSILSISKVSPVKCSVYAVSRFVVDENKWKSWWPAMEQRGLPGSTSHKKLPSFNHDGISYHVTQKFYNSVEVTLSGQGFTQTSRINFLKVSNDSVIIEWNCLVPASINPLKRMMDYRKAVRMSNNMESVLSSMKSFLEKTENVYGVNIHQVISKDSTLITTKKMFDTYPTTTEIYEMVSALNKHIAAEGAVINNVPMLNVRTRPGPQFETMVAIPVDRKLRETPTILNKRFVPWKTLVGDVKGGIFTIQEAQHQMKFYIEDHQRNAMGIPFELLITDRSQQPDTSKWITRICQAVS